MSTFRFQQFISLARRHALYPIAQIDFRGHAHSQPKVSALTLGHRPAPMRSELLTIYRAERVYSVQSEQYLAPFLLRFGQTVAASPCHNRSVSA